MPKKKSNLVNPAGLPVAVAGNDNTESLERLALAPAVNACIHKYEMLNFSDSVEPLSLRLDRCSFILATT